MNTDFRILYSSALMQAVLFSTLLFVPLASQAQSTFFGSGGTTNKALNTSNLAFGYEALSSNTTGYQNTAYGSEALFNNTTGYQNTAYGLDALYYNTTGYFNTASGFGALYYNTTGFFNTANGYGALYYNTTGDWNIANGTEALYSNTVGDANTADGVGALQYNITGGGNTASGLQALRYNTTGYYNSANGYQALCFNTTGGNNTADGVQTLYNSTGNNNIAIGYSAGSNLTTGSNNIDIGNPGVAGEGETLRIGTAGTQTSTYIAGIDGVTASKGVAVYINASGQLGTLKSARRFKKDIHEMGKISDKLIQLRPVTFRYKEAAEDGTHPLQYGLIAEEVAKVYPDLVQYDKAGKPFTIYYHLLTPMLLNELQKSHRQSDAQKAEITAMKAAHQVEIASLKATLQAQSVTLQAQSVELAALKQSQQQQLTALVKLTALVRTSQNKAPLQRAVYTQHKLTLLTLVKQPSYSIADGGPAD